MLSKIALMTATVSASAWTYDYDTDNGSDWPDLTNGDETNYCGDSNQSPINLISRKAKGGLYNKTYKKKKYSWKDDRGEDKEAVMKEYSNQFGAQQNMNGHTVQIDLDVAEGADPNYFISQLAGEVFGADTKFVGQQFHFHAGSEHTIDDERYDLEMHTVHYPEETKEGFIAAALGIVFSIENYTAKLSWAEERIIDTFFDSLQFDDTTAAGVTGPVIDMVTYGNLMQMVDFNNRWVYKGSVTTPPCATNVYWNVLQTIYPVKAKHVELFKEQLDKVTGLKDAGNWRLIQETTEEHAVMVVEQKKDKGLIAGPMSMITKLMEKILAFV